MEWRYSDTWSITKSSSLLSTCSAVQVSSWKEILVVLNQVSCAKSSPFKCVCIKAKLHIITGHEITPREQFLGSEITLR
jgi:hypothetical protein